MNFVFTYAPGTTLEQMVAFETAGRVWADRLQDNVTVNIYVEPTNTLPVGVAGGALMGVQADQAYSAWRTRLAADSKTGTDQSVLQRMPANTGSFTAWVNDVGPEGLTSNKSEQTSSTLNVSRANAKALGLTNGQGGALDGYILMNNQLASLGLNWDYSVNGNIAPGSVSYFSVAIHEIGHVLGFYSGVDASGWQITPIDGFYNDDDDDDDDDGGGGGELDPRSILRNATGLDMLRYSNENSLDLVIGGSPFYSINGGTTKSADYATGVNRNLGGDGFQASHWKSSGGALGIMEPTIAPGQRKNLRPLDQQALDAIGWDASSAGPASPITLQNQAKAALAARLNVTVAQLEANPSLVQQLTGDRSADAIAMIDQSQIYEWRWNQRGRRSGYWDTIDLPPSPARSAASVASSRASARGNTLETGWGLAAEIADRLTAGGQNRATSTSSSLSQSLEQQGNLASSNLPSYRPTSSYANMSLAPVDALAPNYLIGTELLQSGF
jgi:hypothetical protein